MRARVHLFTAHTTSSNNQRMCSKKNVQQLFTLNTYTQPSKLNQPNNKHKCLVASHKQQVVSQLVEQVGVGCAGGQHIYKFQQELPPTARNSDPWHQWYITCIHSTEIFLKFFSCIFAKLSYFPTEYILLVVLQVTTGTTTSNFTSFFNLVPDYLLSTTSTLPVVGKQYLELILFFA